MPSKRPSNRGASSVPEIREAVDLEKLLAAGRASAAFSFATKRGDAPPIADALAADAPLVHGPILTGPEGGFDPAERARIRALPFVTAVSLGPRILRADTAALAALASGRQSAATGDSLSDIRQAGL